MTRTLIKCISVKNIKNRKLEAQRNLHYHEDVKFPNVSEVGIINLGGRMSEGQDPHLVRRKCGNHLKIILFSSPAFPLLALMYLTLMLTEGHSSYMSCVYNLPISAQFNRGTELRPSISFYRKSDHSRNFMICMKSAGSSGVTSRNVVEVPS